MALTRYRVKFTIGDAVGGVTTCLADDNDTPVARMDSFRTMIAIRHTDSAVNNVRVKIHEVKPLGTMKP